METPINPALNETEEQLNATTAPEQATPDAKEMEQDATENKRLTDLSAAELVDKFALLLQEDTLPKRQQVESFKSAFYKIKNRVEADKNAEPAEVEEVEVHEQRLKDFLNIYKEKHQIGLEELNQKLEQNREKKQKLIARLKELLDSTEEFGKISPIFHDIRTEWKECGPVAEQYANDLQRDYNNYVEQFYDLKQINDEFRDYDFRKNLEQKRELIAEAEKLTHSAEPQQAFRALQELHRQWREIGPVAVDLRESIWAEFKQHSTTINKNHQDFFDKRKEREEANLEAKTKLCEEVEQMLAEPLTQAAQWDEHTKKLLKLQNEWKQIGYAPKKENDQIYRRFRVGCDHFFEMKSEFFTRLRANSQESLQKKQELLEQAEAMKDSEDWKETTDKFIELQRRWKEIETVRGRQSREVWTKFQAACDYFFEQKKKNFREKKAQQNDIRSEERDNLKKKKAIIVQVRELSGESEFDTVRTKLAEYDAAWREIGFVPFKMKEKIYQDYRQAVDEIYAHFNESRSNARHRSKPSDRGERRNFGGDERSQLNSRLANLMQQLQTYVNNLSFLNVSSAKGNSLVQEIERKKEKLEADIIALKEKIAALAEKPEPETEA